MRFQLARATRLGILAALLLATVADAAHIPGQRVVAHQVIDILPPAIGRYYAAHIDGVIERTLEPDSAWRYDTRLHARDEWHYLMLDAAAADASPQARRSAAQSFPTSRSAARDLFRDHNIQRGGLLPWELAERARELADAFRGRDEDRIIELTGQIIHFSADGGDPFCCTRNRRGSETGNVDFGESGPGQSTFAHQDVAHRIGWELMRRNALRYGDELARRRVNCHAIDAEPESIIEVMRDSLEALEPLCKADAAILADMGIDEADGFMARADEYYLLLDRQCATACEDSLARGTELAAGLIQGAWQAAGSPDLMSGPTPRASPPPVAGSTPPPASATGYVASKNSKVYHRADCSHAKRINPENLIHFHDAREARDSGRRPCKTCKPD